MIKKWVLGLRKINEIIKIIRNKLSLTINTIYDDCNI